LENPFKHLKKSPNESKAETTLMMLPSDANPKGNVFGGVILKHVDLTAGIVAKRHANQSNVVTASIDRMTFIKPIFISNALILEARINYVKRSSMEIEVNIFAEDLDYNIRVHAGRAYVTMVSIDKYGKSMEVPRLLLETEEDHQRFKEGEARMLARLREAGKL
jgi:acyl-CoA hydrolase